MFVKSLDFVLETILITQTQRKPKKSYKSKNVRFPARTMCNSILFTSKFGDSGISEMDSACFKEHATEISSDSDHWTKVALLPKAHLLSEKGFSFSCYYLFFVQDFLRKSPIRLLTNRRWTGARLT